jgi:hypothetical protein
MQIGKLTFENGYPSDLTQIGKLTFENGYPSD